MRKHLRSPGNGSSVSNTSLDSVSDVGHVVKISRPRHIPEKGGAKMAAIPSNVLVFLSFSLDIANLLCDGLKGFFVI
jgi:hypothetical protein